MVKKAKPKIKGKTKIQTPKKNQEPGRLVAN
jgi:hypothetical protein